MYHTVFDSYKAPSRIGYANSETAVFKGAGYSCLGIFLAYIPYRVQGLYKGCGLVGYLAVGKNLSGTYGIYISHFKGRYSDHLRQLVKIAFGGKTALGNAESSKCSCRGIICIIGLSRYIYILIVVGACRMGAGSLKHRASKAGVCSRIGDNNRLHGRKSAVFVTGRSEIHFHGVALGMYGYAFLSCEFYLNGASCFLGKKGGMMLYAHIFLASEASAYHGSRYTYLLKGQSKGVGTFPLGLVYALVAAYYVYAAVLGKCYGTFGLHKCMFRKGHAVMVRYHIFTFGYGLVGVSPNKVLRSQQVAFHMHKGCVLLHGFFGRKYSLHGFIFNLYGLFSFFKYFGSFRRNKGNGISKIVGCGAYGYYYVPVTSEMAYLLGAGYVLGGHNAKNSVHFFRFALVDGNNLSLCILAS